MRSAHHRLSPTVAGLLALAAIALLIEWLVRAGAVSPFVLPQPTEILRSVGGMLSQQTIAEAFLITFGEIMAVIVCATIISFVLGYLMWRKPVLTDAYYSWLAALFAAPTVLLYPLFLVMFGRGYATIILMAVITSMTPIVLHIVDGLNGVPQTLMNVGRSLNMTPSQLFWQVQLPAAAPSIFTGIRLGLIYGLVNVIGLEFLIVFGGLGRLVSDTYDRFSFADMYAAILFIVLIGFLFSWGLDRVEKHIRPR